MKDGKTFTTTVVAREASPDICWMLTDSTDLVLPTVRLAAANPAPGTRVFHCGYGVDKPENVEYGTVSTKEGTTGQIQYRISVSSGDSGGPIFVEATKEVVGTVCCTTFKGQMADVWAGSAVKAREMIQRLLPDAGVHGEHFHDEWKAEPVEIPSCPNRSGAAPGSR